METISLNSCRVCIYSPGTILTELPYSDIIMMLSKQDFTEIDNIPRSICRDCADKLEHVYLLKLQIQESYEIFQKFLSVNTYDLEVPLKEENSNDEFIYESSDIYNNDRSTSNISLNESDTDEDKQNITLLKISDSLENNVECETKLIPNDSKMSENKRKHKKKRNKMNTADKNRRECNICQKKFTRVETLKIHERIHTGERPFECHICGKRFAQKSNHSAHLKTHDEEKLFICEVCSKQFKAKFHLQQHLNTHLPESAKKYKCDLCPVAFHESNQLKYHKAIHSGEKKHSCSDCSKSFISTRYLNRHIRTVHLAIKQHECTVCGKTFSDKSNLTSHFRIHTGEKPYECKYCDAKFNQSTPLVRHSKQHIVRGDVLKTNRQNTCFDFNKDM